MITYGELTKKRKMMVDLFIQEYPEVQKNGTITFKQMRALWDKLLAARATGGIKIGYPLWITVEQEFRTDTRGVYAVPLPGGNVDAVISKEPRKKIQSKLTAPKRPVTMTGGNEEVITEEEFAALLEDAVVI